MFAVSLLIKQNLGCQISFNQQLDTESNINSLGRAAECVGELI